MKKKSERSERITFCMCEWPELCVFLTSHVFLIGKFFADEALSNRLSSLRMNRKTTEGGIRNPFNFSNNQEKLKIGNLKNNAFRVASFLFFNF